MTDYWAEAAAEPASPPPLEQTRRRRWPWLILAVLVIAGIYTWLTRASGAAEAGVLHVGSQRGGTKAMLLASGALEGAPYRVEWSEFPAAQTLLEAIGAGAVDVGLAGDAPFQFAYQTGSPIIAVGAESANPRPTGALAILVPGASPIHDAAGLRGKRIATTRGSIGHYLILRVLEAERLKPADVQIVFLSPGDAKAASDSGSIDAWSTWTPYTGTAFAAGARSVVDAAAYYSSYGFDVANAQTVAAKRAILTDYLKREAKAFAWVRAHPDAYAKVLAHETGLPIDIALFHVRHMPIARVPIDEALKAEEREVVEHFRTAGALAGTRPIEAAFLPLDQGEPHGG
jgi:sulfonate transport system substrate-binding protein